MKKIFIVIIIFIGTLNVYANSKEKVTLTKCVDGDTALFKINNVNTRVRFLGIDTPESVKPESEAEAYGKKASNYTCDKLTNAKEIYLEYDEKSDEKDKFDRTLAWVWVDSSLLELDLIEHGYAKVRYLYNDYKYTNLLYEKQTIAKENKVGIWSDYEPFKYTVTFNDNGKITEIITEEGEKIKEFIPQKEGYKFIGWFKNNEKFDFNTRIYSNITLTSKYEKDINIVEILLIGFLIIVLYNLKRKVNNHGRKYKTK